MGKKIMILCESYDLRKMEIHSVFIFYRTFVIMSQECYYDSFLK